MLDSFVMYLSQSLTFKGSVMLAGQAIVSTASQQEAMYVMP